MTSEKKAAKKSKKNELSACCIDVPHGGQIIHHFVLSPQLPKNGKAQEWPLSDKKHKDISVVEVGFCVDSDEIQRAFERAIFVVDLKDEGQAENGLWRFVDHGAIPCVGSEDYLNAISTEIINGGTTLLVYVHMDQVGEKETINFGYLASYIDNESGEVRVYRSEDPGIVVGRPVRP